jgi:hypothetical protein
MTIMRSNGIQRDGSSLHFTSLTALCSGLPAGARSGRSSAERFPALTRRLHLAAASRLDARDAYRSSPCRRDPPPPDDTRVGADASSAR